MRNRCSTAAFCLQALLFLAIPVHAQDMVEGNGNAENVALGGKVRPGLKLPQDVLDVMIIGQSKEETWPCACDGAKVIVAADLLPANADAEPFWYASALKPDPEGGFVVRYIDLPNLTEPPQGTPAALQDCDIYTVFSAPADFVAQYTIGVGIVDEGALGDQTTVDVHMIPEDLLDFDRIPGTSQGPYGASYIYRFDGSPQGSGSLADVTISERVTFANDPFLYNWDDIEYGQYTWDLDEDGLMQNWDEYQDPWDWSWFNIHRFHPSPPGNGTPQVEITKQTYGWQCPFCSGCTDFYAHDIFFTLMAYDEGPNIPKVACSIEEEDLVTAGWEYYRGVPYVTDLELVSTEDTLPADGESVVVLAWSGDYIQVLPGKILADNWSWDMPDPLGCDYVGGTAQLLTVIKAGTQTGTLKVRLVFGGMAVSDPTYWAHTVEIELVEP